MYALEYREIGFLHPKLISLMEDLEEEFGSQTITSLYREDGVHKSIPLRALDLRCKNHVVGRGIENWMNDKWEYDPERTNYDVCLYHDTGQGIHLHLQVHENTVRR